MIVKTNEIEVIFSRLIDKLRTDGIEYVEVKTDWYKIIPADRWTSYPDTAPNIGSLIDDYESLRLLISDPQRPFTYVDFDRLASILRAISQELNPPIEDAS